MDINDNKAERLGAVIRILLMLFVVFVEEDLKVQRIYTLRVSLMTFNNPSH